MGVSVSVGTSTCIHMHTYVHMCITLKHTCIEIANGCPMEASMFIMFNMHVCVCVCIHMCAGYPTHPHPDLSTHLPIRRDTPNQ